MSKFNKKIRIKDIAERAEISIGTVDRVLHNRGEVKAETRKKVLAIIEEMGYTPNLLAKSLASKKTYTFAAIIPDSSDNNPYWRKPLEGILKGAAEIKDFNAIVKVFTFNATERNSYIQACEQAIESKPAGIIMDPVFRDASLDFTKKLDTQKIPYVYMDTDLEKGNNLSYFGQDAKQSGQVSARIISKSLQKNSKILIVKLANRGVISHHLLKREEGFKEFFKASNGCTCSFISTEIDLLEKGEPAKSLEKIFNDSPDIKGVFVPNSRVFIVAEYLSRKEDKPIILGYDLIEQNIKYLKSGVIDFLIGQKPEDQGYQSVLTLFNHVLINKEVNKKNYSPIDIIIKENIDFYQ